MRIVITGGLGMLGIELARHLRRARPLDELLLLDVPAAVAPPDDLAGVPSFGATFATRRCCVRRSTAPRSRSFTSPRS